jgi:hypothetical protein
MEQAALSSHVTAFAAIDVASNTDSAAVVCNSLRMIIPKLACFPHVFALLWLTLRRPQQRRWIARRKDLKTGK